MSTVENQNDFTSWKQKDTHRPVLRLPLNATSTTPFVSASTNALPAHKKESEGNDDVHSDLSSSSLAVSPLPIPSVKSGSQQASADAAHHAGHPQKHSGTVPDPTCAVPHPLQTLSRDMASSGSHSFPASDQLLKEKARLLEEEHESLRMSMSEKMQWHGDASHSASALVTAEVAPSAAAAAPSSPSGSSAATPSAFSRDSRGSLTSSTKSSTAVVLECGDGGDGDSGVEVSKRAVVTQATQHRTKDAAAASSVDSASHSLKRTQQSNESDNTRASKASLLRFSSAAASSSSATSSPLDVRRRQDAARRDGHAAQQQQQPSSSPSPRARRPVVSPSPESSTPAPGDAQPESSSSASASAATHALSMEHLRHDVQRCANEIERLVEDQYDLRCSVREALMELSGLVATLRSCAGGPAESFTTTTAAAADHDDDDGHHSRSAAAPYRMEAQSSAAQNENDDKEKGRGGEGGVSLSVSPPASQQQQQQSYDGQHSPAPPAWPLPWLEQLRQEQQTHFQHMKEEMVVLICHAVASAHDGQAYRAASSSEQQQQQRPSLSTAGATRERGRGAVEAAARNGYSLQEVEEDDDEDHHQQQQQQQPPSSLLWQRYRRLLSPTPPNRSERAASSSSTVASEPSVMSLRGQDALWSALRRVQQLVDGQSTQMAQLAERLSVPPQQQQYEQASTAGNREAVEETAYAATKVPRKKAEKPQRHRHEVESAATSRLDSTSTRASERDESISSSFSSSPPPRRHHSRHRETVKTATHKSRSNSSSNNNTTRARAATAVKRKEASTPAEKPSQLDALQDDVSALKQMLRETLARDRYLHEQEERQQQQQQQRKTNDRLSSSRTADDTAVERRHEGSRSSDADTRASTYAQRHYAPAPTARPPPPPLPSQQPQQQQQQQTTSRLPPAQDTRYAPGVAPPHHLQRQPVDEAFRTPVQRSTRQPVNGPPPLSSQSPYASSPIPYDEWVSEEDVYSEGTGSRRGESRSEGWDRAAGAGAPPQERPRQRVRTVLTSSLVYPH